MERRNFLKTASVFSLASLFPGLMTGETQKKSPKEKVENNGAADRKYWADLLYRIAAPVLSNMSRAELQKNMTVELSPSWDGRDKRVTYMEAFGRLMAGMAPWLALPDDDTQESAQRKQLREWALQSYAHAVNPASPDYLLWNKESQPLVDAAYIAESFLRAPKQLWEPLDSTTKQRFIKEFMDLRRIRTPYNNWVLFAAMVETFLLSIKEKYEPFRIDLAVRKTNEWYAGDGWYNDGPVFSFDYYNSFVIHPMLVEVLEYWDRKGKAYELAVQRMQRYAGHLERMISPEGTFPAFGRSVTYRLAAFQPLALLALMENLPEGITPAQVRCALTAVIRRMFEVEGNFTPDNFLQLGFAGHQPDLADYYSNNGSMYLTSLGFLPLGLPATHEFWTAPPEQWTSQKAWSGKPFQKDYKVDY